MVHASIQLQVALAWMFSLCWLSCVTADESRSLSAASAQRFAAAVDSAVSMATSSEQLAATLSSIQSHPETETEPLLSAAMSELGKINADVRSRLHQVRDELGMLFTTKHSDKLRSALNDISMLYTSQVETLQNAVQRVPTWINQCGSAGAVPRYKVFEQLREDHDAIDGELRNESALIFEIRSQRAVADGALAGLEERLGLKRGRRPGEEYELARYLGSSLFRWDLLRTKVAHHLAVAFKEGQEASSKSDEARGGIASAESALSELEAKLQQHATAHKELAERRVALGRQTRTFLKSLVSSCEATDGEGSSMSKRFRILRGKRLGVAVQAAEEFARFLTGAFKQGLPALIDFLREVMAPYEIDDGSFSFPSNWMAKPKVGRWWEWVADGDAGQPVDLGEFEKRFAAAQRRFSVHLSAGEPVVMAYLLWLLLEDALGPTSGPQEILALPSPADVVNV